MVKKKATATERILPLDKGRRHRVVISLKQADFREVSIAAKDANQTVALWIADMVNMSTKP